MLPRPNLLTFERCSAGARKISTHILGGEVSLARLEELVRNCRSYRRFDENHAVSLETLRELVDYGRLAASGNNRQPLKYMLSAGTERNETVFAHLKWAASLKDWGGPQPGERPTGYIIVLGDKQVSQSFGCDHGIASQNILLAATELGLGGCMLGAVNRDGLRSDFAIPDRYEILLVLAIGRPAETVVIDEAPPGSSVTYWRDADGVHHVPKRGLDEVIVG